VEITKNWSRTSLLCFPSFNPSQPERSNPHHLFRTSERQNSKGNLMNAKIVEARGQTWGLAVVDRALRPRHPVRQGAREKPDSKSQGGHQRSWGSISRLTAKKTSGLYERVWCGSRGSNYFDISPSSRPGHLTTTVEPSNNAGSRPKLPLSDRGRHTPPLRISARRTSRTPRSSTTPWPLASRSHRSHLPKGELGKTAPMFKRFPIMSLLKANSPSQALEGRARRQPAFTDYNPA